MDINSGGAVFFCIFDGADPADTDESTERETVAVVKFCANRLAAQSEYFAFEIAKSLGVVAPTKPLGSELGQAGRFRVSGATSAEHRASLSAFTTPSMSP